jgi:hypothetical protein
VIVMDRENPMARGWSHVLSTTNDLEELDRFRERVGAPTGAAPAITGGCTRPQARAATGAGRSAVRVFQRTADMLRFLNEMRPTEPPGGAVR